MTSKGQVTIPKDIREKLDIAPGDDVGFREDGDAVYLEKKSVGPSAGTDGERRVRAFIEFCERMRREGKIDPYYAQMTTDEIMEDLRGYSEDADNPGFKRPD